jgi:hypothetical protein
LCRPTIASNATRDASIPVVASPYLEKGIAMFNAVFLVGGEVTGYLESEFGETWNEFVARCKHDARDCGAETIRVLDEFEDKVYEFQTA